jgi:hypothetical protein
VLVRGVQEGISFAAHGAIVFAIRSAMAITMIVDFFTAAASFGRGFLQAFLTPEYNCIQ